MTAFHGEKRKVFLFHQGCHICPRHKEPFTQAPFFTVNQSVKDLHPKVAHTYFVGVRKTESEMQRAFIPCFDRRVHLTAGISRCFLYLFEHFLDFFIQIHPGFSILILSVLLDSLCPVVLLIQVGKPVRNPASVHVGTDWRVRNFHRTAKSDRITQFITVAVVSFIIIIIT